ncbi:MAG TPA: DUF4169 family protein [Rhizomicrobium sp.]|jgi:hypothetical protein
MTEIVNLRRVRKGKARAAKEAEADANRMKHGVAKPVRDLAKARADKATREIDSRKLDEN